MREWSVMLESESDGGAVLLEEMEDAVDRALVMLSTHSPSATYSPTSYSLRVCVKARTAPDAIPKASLLVAKAATRAGLPPWEVVTVGAVETTRLDAALLRPVFPDLIGLREVADLLGVSRQRASALTRREDFPLPAADIASGPVWVRKAVEQFVATWPRRPGRPRKQIATG